MQYNPLGKTDLRVSRLCLGCMTFGEPDRGNHAWTLPEESSRPIIKRALEGGINFFDTANSYSDGSSEEIVGRALRDFARREDVVVATKVFHRVGDLPEGLSRAQILRSIDDSLRRLGMVWFMGHDSSKFRITESVFRFGADVRAGDDPREAQRRLIRDGEAMPIENHLQLNDETEESQPDSGEEE